ncbi:glycosyltransferase family 2 protein [Roseivirga sp. BDSF3-8]|uniref:glycosyltransferase family 2 protein n=1 Tax=Roseivirga sp. BDSF3-8 TaxID=3241598 RepID=UPI0035327416
MQKITAIIPTFNEAVHIEEAIKSVRWADEVIVVDSFSTDGTVDLARPLADRVLEHEYVNSATQKNWTIPQAKHEWIFLLDADERVPEKLQKEVQGILERGTDKSAFWIGRQNHFMGRRVNYSGWQNDAVIRLFRRDNCRYQDLHVHAEVETEGKVGRLKNKLDHFTYTTLEQYLFKFHRYTSWSAYDYVNRSEKITGYHLFLKPFWRFFKHYIMKRGFLDGKVGFILSVMASYTVFERYMKAWRIKEGEELSQKPKGKR